LHQSTQLPIWIKPNAGLPNLQQREHATRARRSLYPSRTALLAAGASFWEVVAEPARFYSRLKQGVRSADEGELEARIVSPMRLKIISCEIFFRELCACWRARRTLLILISCQGLHDIGCESMRARLQAAVDRVEERQYDALLMGYGLCNNGIVGLTTKSIPLVVPRGHDCITVFMGSAAKYMEYFNSHPASISRHRLDRARRGRRRAWPARSRQQAGIKAKLRRDGGQVRRGERSLSVGGIRKNLAATTRP